MTYFGNSIVKIPDYQEPKPNLLDALSKTIAGEAPAEGLIIPLMTWLSNHPNNIQGMQLTNQHFFWANKSILTHMIPLNIDKSIRFIKYPKSKTEKDDSFDFLIPHLLRYYEWSEKEYEHYKELIDLGDKELHTKLHQAFGFTQQECRKLGISFEKLKIKFEKKKPGFFQ